MSLLLPLYAHRLDLLRQAQFRASQRPPLPSILRVRGTDHSAKSPISCRGISGENTSRAQDETRDTDNGCDARAGGEGGDDLSRRGL
jgi:hypothetical protein